MNLLPLNACRRWAWTKPLKQIYDGEILYLERFYLGAWRDRTFFLHRFVNPDPDRGLHDHPWHAFSLLLYGSYTEELLEQNQQLYYTLLSPQPNGAFMGVPKYRYRHITRFNRLEGFKFHRVHTLHAVETWSLFVHQPRHKNWGFWRDGRYREFEPFREHRESWQRHAQSKQALFAAGKITDRWGPV